MRGWMPGTCLWPLYAIGLLVMATALIRVVRAH
jgi:hypothetical protein